MDSVYADPEYPKFAVFYSRLVKLVLKDSEIETVSLVLSLQST